MKERVQIKKIFELKEITRVKLIFNSCIIDDKANAENFYADKPKAHLS